MTLYTNQGRVAGRHVVPVPKGLAVRSPTATVRAERFIVTKLCNGDHEVFCALGSARLSVGRSKR